MTFQYRTDAFAHEGKAGKAFNYVPNPGVYMKLHVCFSAHPYH